MNIPFPAILIPVYGNELDNRHLIVGIDIIDGVMVNRAPYREDVVDQLSKTQKIYRTPQSLKTYCKGKGVALSNYLTYNVTTSSLENVSDEEYELLTQL